MDISRITSAAASAVYRKTGETNFHSTISAASAGGFGNIRDVVTLSPQAMALMNGQASNDAGPREGVQSGQASDTSALYYGTVKTPDKPPSDPFRAYRGKDGQLSLEAMLQIEMLPPRLRKAGKLMREAESLRDEVAAKSKDPATDPKALADLQAEYDGVKGQLMEELDKLGLTKKMKDSGLSIDDVISSGLDGLQALSGDAEGIGNADGSADDQFRASVKVAPTVKESEAKQADLTPSS